MDAPQNNGKDDKDVPDDSARQLESQLSVPEEIDTSEFQEIPEEDMQSIEDIVPKNMIDIVQEGDTEEDSVEPFDEEAPIGEYEQLDDELSSSAAMAAATEADAEKSIGRNVLEWVGCIATAMILALLLRTFVFSLVRVEGVSMNPTLADEDRLFVQILLYEPKQKDIIVFMPDETRKSVKFVKRVIATEGQTIDINFQTGAVTVDGKVLDEPYVAEPLRVKADMQFPVVVPKDCVFVMGDNRNHSHDSRWSDVGFVNKKAIIGGAKFRIYPFSKFGALE